MKGSEEQGGQVTFSKNLFMVFNQKKNAMYILNRILFSSTMGANCMCLGVTSVVLTSNSQSTNNIISVS